jgi:hypothetical protein
MSQKRIYHTATLLFDGKVLAAGGSSAELYDPATGAWTATGSMTVPRDQHTATLLRDGKVLVAGGSPEAQASAELYDPATGTWSATGSLTVGRFEHTATLLPDGRVLVAGGEDFVQQDALASAELYDPATGSWTATGQMIHGHANNGDRGNHAAALLPDGRVLVAPGAVAGYGGPDAGFTDYLATAELEHRDAELYDPATGSWSVAGTFIYFDSHAETATRLPDGRVLVTNAGFDAELFVERRPPEPDLIVHVMGRAISPR